MVLNSDADLTAFLEAVRACAGEVLFETRDGDRLNLKSFLSGYLFSMVATNQNYVLSGQVVCRVEDDYRVLAPFLHRG